MTSYVVGYGSGENLEPAGGFENPQVITHGQGNANGQEYGHGHRKRGLALLIISTISFFYSLYVAFSVLGLGNGYLCHSPRQFYLFIIVGLFWTLTLLTSAFRFLGPYIQIGLGFRGRCNLMFILVFWIKVAICYSIIIVCIVAVGSKEEKMRKSLCPNWSFIIPPTFLIFYGVVIGLLTNAPIAHAHFIN